MPHQLVAPCTLMYVALLSSAGASQHEPRFPRMAFTGLGDIRDIDSGDLDGDGRTDVVLALDNPLPEHGDIGVVFGDPAGGFSAPDLIDIGADTRALELVDLDADGHLDLLAVSAGSDALHALAGDGSGAFATPSVHACGEHPVALDVADLDLDGDLDAVVGLGVGSGLASFLGDGAGGFTGPLVTAATGHISGVSLGDIDGDGLPDAFTAGSNGIGLAVWSGAGDGGFHTPLAIETSIPDAGLLLADATGDGHLDLVHERTLGTQAVIVRPGDGAGGFGAPIEQPLPGAIFGNLDVADVTGDGHPDVIAGVHSTACLAVVAGDGAGGFDPPVVYRAEASRVVHATHLDDDGHVDLVVGGYNGAVGPEDITLELWLSRPLGGLDLPWSSEVPGFGALNLFAPGDFDEDGHTDLLATCDDALVLLRGDGLGDVAPTPAWVPEGNDRPHGMAVGDMDNDGHLDAVVGASMANMLRVLRGDGAGGFALHDSEHTCKQPHTVQLADLDRDGLLDVLVASDIEACVARYRGVGGGRIDKAGELAVFSRALAVGDLDLDGFPDAALAAGGNEILLLPGDGEGGFEHPSAVAASDTGVVFGVALADVNADGDLDLLASARDDDLPGPTETHRLHTFLGDGLGHVHLASSTSTSHSGGLLPADVDGDGHLDVFMDSHLHALLLGDGAGGFGPPRHYGGFSLDPPVAADMNGDGRLDLISWVPASTFYSNPEPDVGVSLDAHGPLGRLQGGLSGVTGEPTLSAQGTLVPDSDLEFRLANAAAHQTASWLLGAALLGAPFKQGLLVPTPDLVVGSLPTDEHGQFAFSVRWPTGLPAGLTLFSQAWIVDPAAPAGLSASNGLSLTAP